MCENCKKEAENAKNEEILKSLDLDSQKELFQAKNEKDVETTTITIDPVNLGLYGLINFYTILTLKMQNMDNKIGLFANFKDLLVKERLKVLFRGAFPAFCGFMTLSAGQIVAEENTNMKILKWPQILLFTQILAHPWFVISARVMSNKGRLDKNMFVCAQNLARHEGLRGFYRGFLPLLIFQLSWRYEDLYYFIFG